MNDVIGTLVKNNLVSDVTSQCHEQTEKNKEKYTALSLDNYEEKYQESELSSAFDAEYVKFYILRISI